jgi:hypothetical protein
MQAISWRMGRSQVRRIGYVGTRITEVTDTKKLTHSKDEKIQTSRENYTNFQGILYNYPFVCSGLSENMPQIA